MSKPKTYCPAHPDREFPAHYRFCDVCGQPLSAQAAVSEAGPSSVAEESFAGTCPQCDTPYRPGWRFCQKCRATLPTEPLKESSMNFRSPRRRKMSPKQARCLRPQGIFGGVAHVAEATHRKDENRHR